MANITCSRDDDFTFDLIDGVESKLGAASQNGDLQEQLIEVPAVMGNSEFRKAPKFIIVPQRRINGDDLKFEDDPWLVPLYGLLSAKEYKREIGALNAELIACRATTFDHLLLISGPFMAPLALWFYRNKQRKLKRRAIMEGLVERFNRDHPTLLMRWQTRPQKMLMIWRLEDANIEVNL